MSDLKMSRGDDASLTIGPVLDSASVVINITGVALWFTAKHSVSDLDTAAVFQKSTAGGSIVITNGPGGLARVDIAAANTASLPGTALLYWDLQSKDGANKIATLASGRLLVDADVTRAA